MAVLRLLACVLTTLVSTTLPAQRKDVFTPLVASPTHSTTYVFSGTDHKQHLVYELVLTNTGAAPATVQKLEVISTDDSATVLATFEGDALLRRLRMMGRGPGNASQIGFNESRLFLIDFTLDQGSRPPATVMHRFHLLAAGGPGSPPDKVDPYAYTIAPISISTEVTTLGPPLAGRGWVALNGCCEPGGAHRSTGLPVNGEIHFAQRFAIDWMLLGADARFGRAQGKAVTDYADYGAKVLAVADGTVVETLATLEDQIPGQLPDPKTINLDNVDGNHIVLDLGNGKYAFYAHLQKNSLLVANGAHVKRGQPLALLGNTGNTSAPHLHFHLMDGTSVLGSSGLPYVIDHFDVIGQLSAKEFEAASMVTAWSKSLFAQPLSRSEEFPLDLTVVSF